MREVSARVRALARSPGGAALWVAVAAGGCALATLPLFGLPGFELATAMTLLVCGGGGGLGIAAAFAARRASPPEVPASPLAFLSRLWAAAFLLGASALGPPLVFATLRTVLFSPCDPFLNVGFYPLLTLPTAALASAVGLCCGLWGRTRLRAAALYALWVAASAVWTVWPLVFGPQVYALNHFGGYFPGPLYDEALVIRSALYWFRGQTLLWTAAVVLWTALSLKVPDLRLGRPRWAFRTGLLFLLVFGAALAIELAAPALRLRMSDRALAEALGGHRETAHYQVYFPRGRPKEEIDQLERDLEFRHQQLARFFGDELEGKARVYVYASAAQKQELVGAGHTQFAKPWRLEAHLNELVFPHPTLKHELAHVLSAPLGSGPFKVASRLGLFPLIGLIEGIAVAADNPADQLTLHQWSAAMRRQKLAPDVRALLGPRGFYAAAPARAYTLAGSFVSYLVERHGAQKLRRLYADGDFDAAYGRSLDALATEWESFLDALPLDEQEVNQAFLRFRHGSLFARPCAREVAKRQERAAALSVAEPARALQGYERCAAMQPGEVPFHLARVTLLERMGEVEKVPPVLEEADRAAKGRPAFEAQVALARADLAFFANQRDVAAEQLQRALAARGSPELDRTARIKLAALGSSSASEMLFGYFRPGREEVKLVALREALVREPQNANLSYVLGRRLVQGGAPALARAHLARALEAELPESIRKEAYRLWVEALYRSGDCAGVRDAAGRAPGYGEAFSANLTDWVSRCAFEEAAFNGPLVPSGPFR